MANIKNKFSQPLSTEFSPKDLVVDIKNGHLYYKSNLGVHKLTGNENARDNHGIMFISSGSSTDEGGHLTLLPPLEGGYIWNVDNYQENLRLFTEGTETAVRMQISSSGNVGIGTTTPDFKLDVAGDIGMDGKLYHNGDHDTYIGFTADQIDLRTGGTDRVTINQHGRVGIGVDPLLMLDVEEDRDGTFIAKIKNSDTSDDAHVLILQTGESTVSTSNHFIVFRNGGGSNIGAIKGDGDGGITLDEGSDIRLKKEISPTKYGIGNLMGIEIVEYKYKDSNKFRTGIIAQQAIDYYPPAVKDHEEYNIEKGLTPEDKEYQYMTVAYQKYIPLLMKSLQDSYTQITELEKRIKKLENG